MPSLEETLHAGLDHHRAGRLSQAEHCYREVLLERPDHPDALHLLGLTFLQRSDARAAIEPIRRAIQLHPRCAAYHNNLGEAYRAIDQFIDAASCYQSAISLDANYPDPWINLGIIRQREGAFEEADKSYRQALKLAPSHPLAWLNLGTLLQALGQFRPADQAYQNALRVDGRLHEAYNNLGTIAKEEGRLEDAERHYRTALSLEPGYVDASYNLGVVLKHRGKLIESAKALQAAIEKKPDFDHAIERLADVMHELGEHHLARRCIERLGELRPSRWIKFKSRILCPTVFPDAAAIDEYRAQLDRTLDEFMANPLQVPFEELLLSGCEPPFELQFHGRDELATRRKFAAVFKHCIPEMEVAPRVGMPKVGIVVTESHEAAFARSLIPLLNEFSTGSMKMDILCAAAGLRILQPGARHPDLRIRPLSSRVRERPRQIADGDYDLLYYWEVGTDSQNYFLPFLRLAPVQCTSWGIQLTSGIPAMDIYLSHGWVESDNAPSHYSERLVLGDSMLSRQARPVSTRLAEQRIRWRGERGFSEQDHLYLCPHQLGKFHPEFDVVLEEILARDPAGRVLITADKSEIKTEHLAKRLKRRMAESFSRIHLLPRQSGMDYYGMLAAGDVLLDPMPFGGVNTTYDGLALGKPIVTCPSAFHRGRFTFGCFQKMDVLDTVANSRDAYASLAVHLATDDEFRRDVSARISKGSDVLFDDPLSSVETEQFFLEWIMQQRENT
ncbi:MAG: tetratricopeptide repeat protein [Planctomycetota bacterium]